MGIEDDQQPREHKLVMYTSPDFLEQFFNEYSEDISKRIKSESVTTSKEVSGEIGGVIGKLGALANKKTGEELIEEVNFSNEYRQVRALMNQFTDSDLVYSTKDLLQGRESPTGLYKFDSHIQLYETEDAGKTFYQVSGIENSVEFTGHTSPENWTSRSFVLSAKGSIDPFPFEGVFFPIEIGETHSTEMEEGGFEVEKMDVTVQFIYILSPDPEDYIDWSNYQRLLDKHPKNIDSSGMTDS